jgi:hypothetical protein
MATETCVLPQLTEIPVTKCLISGHWFKNRVTATKTFTTMKSQGAIQDECCKLMLDVTVKGLNK